MKAFYNDNDPKVCAWLRELIKAGLITEGIVDGRPIQEIKAEDLSRFSRVHFFAGIGGWDYALKLAGWPEDEPVWTGSCPCQPFSCAGKQLGERDPRHLWPEMRRLIDECRPAIVFGEQVASKDGRVWLSGVRADLEALGYAVGGSDLCAAGIGAPHPRQRLYWMAYAKSTKHEWLRTVTSREQNGPSNGCTARGLVFTNGDGSFKRKQTANGVGHRYSVESASRDGYWDEYDIAHFTDGKTRRVESGTFPLAHGVPERVVPSGDPSVPYAQATSEARTMRLKGYGNSICVSLAVEFIQASVEAIEDSMKDSACLLPQNRP